MIGRVLRRALLVATFIALPAAWACTGSGADRHRDRLDRRRAAGRHGVALHEATGNRFEAITDEPATTASGARRRYTLTAELQGFTTVTRPGVQLLVGQTAAVNLQMSPSTVQETVTVTAEAPILNVATSSLGGNVDPRRCRSCR